MLRPRNPVRLIETPWVGDASLRTRRPIALPRRLTCLSLHVSDDAPVPPFQASAGESVCRQPKARLMPFSWPAACSLIMPVPLGSLQAGAACVSLAKRPLRFPAQSENRRDRAFRETLSTERRVCPAFGRQLHRPPLSEPRVGPILGGAGRLVRRSPAPTGRRCPQAARRARALRAGVRCAALPSGGWRDLVCLPVPGAASGRKGDPAHDQTGAAARDVPVQAARSPRGQVLEINHHQCRY
ncbi:hypothetical protein GPNCGGLF_LOCUS2290 [Methylorubrum aminovorans]